MIQYTIRRSLLAIPVLFVAILVTFVIARSIPGDPCHSILGEKATKERCDQFTEDHALNEPIYVQMFLFLEDLVQGNLGVSIPVIFLGGRGNTIMHNLDVVLSFPALLLAIAIVFVMEDRSLTNAMIAIGIVRTPLWIRPRSPFWAWGRKSLRRNGAQC